MRLNGHDSGLLRRIATTKSAGGKYFVFEQLLIDFGHWSRHGVMPTIFYPSDVTRPSAPSKFKEPLDVFMLIDHSLLKFKFDPQYQAEYLAFDLYFLTSGHATEVRRKKSAKLKRLLNSYPCMFLRDYAQAHERMQNLVRNELLLSLKMQ